MRAVIVKRAEVTRSVAKSAPPKTQLVGQVPDK